MTAVREAGPGERAEVGLVGREGLLGLHALLGGRASPFLAVVQVGVLNVAFGTVPLSPAQWAVCVAMGSSVLWLGELRKWALRLHERRRGSGLGRPPRGPA